MKKINTVALSEKGALKPAVRTAINGDYLPQIADALEPLGFTFNAEKKAYDSEFVDTNGNSVYLVLTATVGLKASADKAVKKPSTRKTTVEKEVITIED